MKKVIVISDTHGNKKIFDHIFQNIDFDHLLFLGDGIADLGVYVNDPRVKVVRGNCDFFSHEKTEAFLSVENVLIFYTHGHNYSVKFSLKHLINRVEEIPTNIVCFGHTHKFVNETYNSTTFLNPGSASLNRSSSPSYAIITIRGENFSIEKCNF